MPMNTKDDSRAYEFAMGFIASSDAYRRQYVDRWQEVLSNFAVEPLDHDYATRTTPYSHGRVYTSRSKHRIILKDPETHKAVMTYASKLVKALFSEREGEWIKARPRGYEDAPLKAPTVNRLLRYAMGLRGHFRTFVESLIDMLIFGTSIIEVTYEYEEREVPLREVTSELGVELDQTVRLRIPVYDDVKLCPVDIADFYPDPARYRIQDMSGAAKRFRMNSIEAKAKAQSGIYDKVAVRQAVKNMGRQSSVEIPESFRIGIDQPRDKKAHSDFREMIGYEYWGDVPWEDDQGSSRRVITVLNNVVVRNDPWPLSDPALPWHSLIINPVQGRFYGISPAEVIRFDQDFADAMKVLLAEAVIRQVHPPIAVDIDADVDTAAVKAWKADAIIHARGGPSSVGTIRYDANVANGFGMLASLKASMQEASGALEALQGLPGPDRESATVGAARINMAMDRPELAAMVIEKECLPPIGEAILRRYQQFIDTDGLRDRIGELPQGVWIGEIMGDFDIEFIGSRLGASKQERMMAFDRLIALASAVPQFAVQIPWDALARDIVGDMLELPDIAGLMPSNDTIIKNILLARIAESQQGANNGNGVANASQPPNMTAAQSTGGILQ